MSNDSVTDHIEPISVKPHAAGNGVQRLYRFDNGYGASVVQVGGSYGVERLYRFDNGYGASVVQFSGSYGVERGLWELGVIRWRGEHFALTYNTPITGDVIGYLDEGEIQDYLRQIRALPAVES